MLGETSVSRVGECSRGVVCVEIEETSLAQCVVKASGGRSTNIIITIVSISSIITIIIVWARPDPGEHFFTTQTINSNTRASRT